MTRNSSIIQVQPESLRVIFRLIVMLALLFPSGCGYKETADPREFADYAYNISGSGAAASELNGYLEWSWGSPPDSMFFNDIHGKSSLADYARRHGGWITRRKSGLVRISLNMLPDLYNRLYGIRFDSAHLIFRPPRGFISWERVVDSRARNGVSSAVDSLYTVIIDTLTASIGAPHLLGERPVDEEITRRTGALWKSPHLTMDVSLYEFKPDGRRIVWVARHHPAR